MNKIYKTMLVGLVFVFGMFLFQGCAISQNDKIVNTPLTSTFWKLVSIESKSITVYKNMKEPYLLFEKDGKSVKGFGGCNSMFGSFNREGQDIKIGPLASTRKACLNGMDTEAEFHKAISETKKWQISENILKLSNKNGKTLAEFKAK